jgi:hypothetical protein
VKQSRPIVVTDGGIQIDESDEQFSNAESPIHESLEPDSNMIVERNWHPMTAPSQIVSTAEGIQTNPS